MKPAAAILCVTLLCLTVGKTSSLVVSSMTSVGHLVDQSLAAQLQKFIQHEERRLKVIHNVSRYEDEEPLVVQRIKEFKSLHAELLKNETVNEKLRSSVRQGHPTSIYAVIRNFVAGWEEKLHNRTLYGKRLMEFLNSNKEEKRPLYPRRNELQVAGTALTVAMTTYNVSMRDVIKGNVLGNQGEPLNAADCYDIAKSCMEAQLLEMAGEWLEAALGDVDISQVTQDATPFNLTDAMVNLAKIVFQQGDSPRALKLLERAADIDPDDEKLHSLYLQYRWGRDVKRMPTVDHQTMEKWRTTFFDMCGNATLSPLALNTSLKSSSRKCRYRPSVQIPYVRYKEEILSFSPHISVLYDVVGPKAVEAVKNFTKNKLTAWLLPGNDKATLWQYQALIIKDRDGYTFRNLSTRIGDFTGLVASQGTWRNFGEPIHAIDYGMGGTCLPHADNLKQYRNTYMGITDSNRLATIQVFMDDTKAGGEVVFLDPQVTVKPRKGMVLLYFNNKPDGRKETKAYAGTCPLAVGKNLVLEKGVWTSGLDDNALCGDSHRTTFFGLEKTRMERRKQVIRQKEEMTSQSEEDDAPEDAVESKDKKSKKSEDKD